MGEYDAFLSYSHETERIATALQDGLQRFAKPWWRRRALRIFLDRTVLSANPGLWSSIAEALDNSEWFILVASPEAANSAWVNREVAYWLELHGTERLLIAVADGQWIWEEELVEPGMGGNAVPKALLGAYLEEPRLVDLRWAKSDPDLDLHNPLFRDQLAELAAPVRNVSKDELEGADLREHRRFRHIAIGVGAVLSILTLASLTAGIAAVIFAHRAAARTADADFARLVAQSRNLSASNPSLAILLAVEATRLQNNAQSNGAILATLSQDPRFVGTIVPTPRANVTSVCVAGSSRDAVVGGSDGTVSAISLRHDTEVTRSFRFGARSDGPAFVTCSDKSRVAIAYDTAGYWSQIDPTSGRPRGHVYLDPGLYSAAVNPTGEAVALSDTSGPGQSGHLRIEPLSPSGSTLSVRIPHSINSGGLGLAFSADGRMLATINAAFATVWNANNLTKVFSVQGLALQAISATPRTPLLYESANAGTAAFSPDGRYLAGSAGSLLELIDLSSRRKVWSEPTGWYAGSDVGFTDDGRLLVNRSAGQVEQIDLGDGSRIGVPIMPHIGVTVDFVLVGSRMITSSPSSSVTSLYDLDSNGPITRTLPLPSPADLFEYDPSGRSLLLSAGGSSSALFHPTRTADDRTGTLGPVLPSLIQPRFIEPHVVGGLQTSFTIGEFDSTSAKLVTPPYFVPFTHATNAQFDPQAHHLLFANTGGDLDMYRDDGTVVASPWARLGAYPVLSTSGFAENGSIAVFDSYVRRVWVLNRLGRVILQIPTDVTMAALSPDAHRLAILHDLHVDLFDAHSGVQIGDSIAVPPGSTDIEWSADGSRILAFGRDQGQLIDTISGQPLGDPLPSSGYLALRPDGKEVATVSNGSLLLWNVDEQHLVAAACQAAGRNLTEAEWMQYLPNEGSNRRVCLQWPPG
jgi:WD40 repeat protein